MRKRPILASKPSVRAATLMAYVNKIKDGKSICIADGYPLKEIFEVFLEDVGVEDLPLYLNKDALGSDTTSAYFGGFSEDGGEQYQKEWSAMILKVLVAAK